jgi:glycosyltransferase involved in cell wall biosynthesis
VGGVEKHVHEVSKRLKIGGHKIKVLTQKEVGKNKWEIWRNIWKYKQLFDWADVVHIHDVYFWVLFLRIFYWRKKFFMTFHGYEGSEAPKLKQIIWHKLGEIFTNGNICIGDFHKKYYFVKPDFVSYGAA